MKVEFEGMPKNKEKKFNIGDIVYSSDNNGTVVCIVLNFECTNSYFNSFIIYSNDNEYKENITKEFSVCAFELSDKEYIIKN